MRFQSTTAYYALLTYLGTFASARVLIESVAQSALAARGWNIVSEPAAGEQIQLEIGLTLSGKDRVTAELYARSDPDSANYGQWLDRDEVNSMIQPDSTAQTAVLSWLQENGATVVKSDPQFVTVQLPITQANELINAQYLRYEREGISKIRTVSYSLPENIAPHIDVIHPTTYFGETKAFSPVAIGMPTGTRTTQHQEEKRQGTATSVSPSCATSITPSCLHQLYNFVDYKADPAAGSRVGFGSFLNQSARYEDLFLYEDYFKIPRQNWTKVFVNDAINDQGTTGEFGEANLDVQNIVGVAPGVPVTEFLTGGKPPFIPDPDLPTENDNTNEPYLPYYQYLLSKTNAELPQAISNSYGEPEQTVPQRYAERVCMMIGMIGLRGISVFESSGDTGVGSSCVTNDGSKKARLNPQFPSSCPFVTSVGGTEKAIPEIAWRDSSGGFSYYFDRPKYQTDVINAWSTTGINQTQLAQLQSYFNMKGRGFPDISAMSLLPNYVIFGGGEMYPHGNGGTSAAAPVVAAIVSLLNDARLRVQKPTMGFINPWLYKRYGIVLRDITQGRTRGCDGINYQTGKTLVGARSIPGAGWDAVPGWDPATGLGVPDFQRMRRVALQDVGASIE